MSSSSKKILVTGGAGYIGSHACKALFQRGYEPVVFDNLENGHAAAVKWGDLEHGDLLDPALLGAVFDRHDFAAVVHFAAYAYVGQSVLDPAAYYRNNVAGSLNLLDAMRSRGVELMVFSSTCATYGVPSRSPICEQEPGKPINPYGRSKLMIEQLLEDYSRAYGLRACSLRYFNAAGADPDGEAGEVHDPEPHLIPNILRAAKGQQGRLKVYGSDYPTPDGTCIRDFVHVSDLAEAHCLAVEYLLENPGNHVFNLGSEKGHSVMEVIKAAETDIGLPVPYDLEARRPGDPPVLVADSSKAERELGWRRQHSGITEILQTAWQWECSMPGFGRQPGRGPGTGCKGSR